MTKDELLDQLDNTRERLLVALEYLPDEALLEPEVVGEWSIADLLSILTAWDAEVVTGLMRLKQGKRPERLLAAMASPETYNAARFVENLGRDLDTIFDDFQGARVQLEDWIEAFSEKALTEVGHYKALGGQALADLILAATAGREAAFLPEVEAFARNWIDEPDDGPPIIPLTGIGPIEENGNGYHPE